MTTEVSFEVSWDKGRGRWNKADFNRQEDAFRVAQETAASGHQVRVHRITKEEVDWR